MSAIAIALSMSVSMFGTSYAQNAEVTANKVHWAQEKMQRWFDLGVIRGNETGDLLYDAYISRAEVTTIINNVFGFSSKASTQFSDVKENSWYADELLKARQAGYLKGYEGNIAKPESKITREDTSMIISQVFELDTSDVGSSSNLFKDAESISDYAASAVNKLASEGVIRGYEDGSFKPKANITRAEFISILDSLVSLLCNSRGVYENKNVSGHAVIGSSSVELKNSAIKGNLYITEGIGNEGLTLNGVAVNGMTYILGGNDIKIVDSEINKLVVNGNASTNSIVISGKTNVSEVIVNSPVNIKVDENAKLALEINSANVFINGQVVAKGVVYVEKGLATNSVEESIPEVPAVVPTTTPLSTPTPTATAAKNSGKTGGSSGSGGSGGSDGSGDNQNRTPKPTSTTEPTIEPTIEPTPTITPEPTPTEPVEPTPPPSDISTKLHLISATADNLKEVVLKFNKPITNKSEAKNVNNYIVSDNDFTTKIKVRNVDFSDDMTTITLIFTYNIKQHSDLKVRINSDIGLIADTTVTINNVKDITVPTILDVEALGNSALKITFSEPLVDMNISTNYLIDGNYFATNKTSMSYNGKTVTFYLNKALQPGIHKLHVNKNMCDYASLHIEENEIEFNVIEDTIPPSGVIESATQTEVVIKFNEAVRDIYIEDILTDPNAIIDDIDQSDDYKTVIIYLFVTSALREEGGLITIKNLSDFSGNSVDFQVNVVPTCDKVRPEYIGYEIKDAQKKIILEFSEDVFDRGEFILLDRDNNEIEVDAYYLYDNYTRLPFKNKLVLTKKDMERFDPGEYTLTIVKVVDYTPQRNEIIEKTVIIDVPDQIPPSIISISKDFEHNEIYLKFDEKVDKTTAETKSNYIYTLDNFLTECLNSNTDVTLLPDEQTVCIKFNKDDTNGVNVGNIKLFQVESICDLAGNKWSTPSIWLRDFDVIGEAPELIEPLPVQPKISDVYLDTREKRIYIMFNQKVDKAIAESKASYLYREEGIIYRELNEFTTVNLLSDGKTVCIQFPKDYANLFDITFIQVNEAAYLSGEKIPAHAIYQASFISRIYAPEVVSAKLVDDDKIVLKLDGPIDENTLSLNDFSIHAQKEVRSYLVYAKDAEYNPDDMEIILILETDIKSKGKNKGGYITISMPYSDTVTSNIFGKKLYSESLKVEDAFAPYVESVSDVVYYDGMTEFYITVSEDLAYNYRQMLDSSTTEQFVVKVNGEKVEVQIAYFEAEYFDDLGTPVNEELARLLIMLDGKYDEEEIEVIFTPSDEATIFDKAGNKLEAFSVTVSPK